MKVAKGLSHTAKHLLMCLAASAMLAACSRSIPTDSDRGGAAGATVPSPPQRPSSEEAGEKTRGDHARDAGETKENDKEHAEAGGVVLGAQELQSAGIRVQTLVPERVPDLVTEAGTVAPNAARLAHIAPQVSGRLLSVDVTPGALVKPGQRLATLQSPEIDTLRAANRTATTDLELAKAHFERMDALLRDQVIARKDWLNAQADVQRASAAAASARERLQLLGVAADGSDSRYALVAPFAGTVTEQFAVQGELASPDKAMFTLADLTTVWVETDIHEQELANIRIGAPADVAVAAYPGRVFPGRFTYVASTLDSQTHTLKARVEVRNPGQLLKIGMLATVTLAGATQGLGFAVPADAVVLISGQPSLFRREGQRFEPVTVSTGARTGGRVVIAAGVKAGDEIVTAGAYPLKARLLKSTIGDAD